MDPTTDDTIETDVRNARNAYDTHMRRSLNAYTQAETRARLGYYAGCLDSLVASCSEAEIAYSEARDDWPKMRAVSIEIWVDSLLLTAGELIRAGLGPLGRTPADAQ